MKIVKFLLFFLILSSCNKYLGTIEPDYEPSNEVTNIFEKDFSLSSPANNFKINEKNFLKNKKYLSTNSSFKEINKLISLDSKSKIFFINDNLISSSNDEVKITSLNNFKILGKYDLSLEKNELVLDIISYKDKILILTNQSSLYEITEDKILLVNRFDVLSEIKPVLIRGDFYIFSVFGELYKLDLSNYTLVSQGKFATNFGLSVLSDVDSYQNFSSYLFNSGTPVFINEKTMSVEDTYFFEDLNILTSLGTFDDLISVPISLSENLLFIDRSGKISLFNPFNSIISWELDLKESIVDFIYSDNEELIILTASNLVFVQKGLISYKISHLIENPFKIYLNNSDLHIISDTGISNFNETGTFNNLLKQNFKGTVDIIINNSAIYIKDSKALYTLSE